MNVNLPPFGSIQPSHEQILASHFTLAAIPDEIVPFDIAGVEGWSSPNPHPVLTLGRWKTADATIAANGIDEALEPFRTAARGMDWMTGPQDAEFLSLLEERGFLAPPLSIAAMIREISLADQPDDADGIATKLIDTTRNDGVSQIMAEGFDIPDNVARIYHNAYVTPSDLQRSDVYVATTSGEEQPGGISYLSYIGGGPIVLLRVAATRAASRGCGMYRSLIKRRLADAAKAGRRVAVVHAYSMASQTALADLGFVKACEFQLHRWRP